MSIIIIPTKFDELSFAEQGMLECMTNTEYNGYSLDDFTMVLPDDKFFIKSVLDNLIRLGYVFLKEDRYYVNQSRVGDAAYYRKVLI